MDSSALVQPSGLKGSQRQQSCAAGSRGAQLATVRHARATHLRHRHAQPLLQHLPRQARHLWVLQATRRDRNELGGGHLTHCAPAHESCSPQQAGSKVHRRTVCALRRPRHSFSSGMPTKDRGAYMWPSSLQIEQTSKTGGHSCKGRLRGAAHRTLPHNHRACLQNVYS